MKNNWELEKPLENKWCRIISADEVAEETFLDELTAVTPEVRTALLLWAADRDKRYGWKP